MSRKLSTYRVTSTIEVQAVSVVQAARLAHQKQQTQLAAEKTFALQTEDGQVRTVRIDQDTDAELCRRVNERGIAYHLCYADLAAIFGVSYHYLLSVFRKKYVSAKMRRKFHLFLEMTNDVKSET